MTAKASQNQKRPFIMRKGISVPADLDLSPVSITSATQTIDRDTYAGKTILLNRAAGITVTLPAASGSGDVYNFVLQTAVTSNSTIIKVANATDVISGLCVQGSDGGAGAVLAWQTAATSDTITFNGSTTGGLKGDKVVLEDVASGLWSVSIASAATGIEATPFSATV